MPSHSSSKGTQASEGMARSAWNDGSSRSSSGLNRPTAAPITRASEAPMAKPMATRKLLATTCCITTSCPNCDKVTSRSLGAGSKCLGIHSNLAAVSIRISSRRGGSTPSQVVDLASGRLLTRTGVTSEPVIDLGRGVSMARGDVDADMCVAFWVSISPDERSWRRTGCPPDQ